MARSVAVVVQAMIAGTKCVAGERWTFGCPQPGWRLRPHAWAIRVMAWECSACKGGHARFALTD